MAKYNCWNNLYISFTGHSNADATAIPFLNSFFHVFTSPLPHVYPFPPLVCTPHFSSNSLPLLPFDLYNFPHLCQPLPSTLDSPHHLYLSYHFLIIIQHVLHIHIQYVIFLLSSPAPYRLYWTFLPDSLKVCANGCLIMQIFCWTMSTVWGTYAAYNVSVEKICFHYQVK